jgi:hypothetical protein
MIRWRNSIFYLICFIISLNANAQDSLLFNEKSIADFARFLFQINKYDFAAEEYERLTFLYPAKEEYQVGLLKSYRMATNYSGGINAFHYLKSPEISVQQEYVKLNLLAKNTQNLNLLIKNLDEESIFRNNLDLTLRLISIDKTPVTTERIRMELVDPGLLELYGKSSTIRHKSPFLASTLSTIIPGTGKIYCGRWKDGLMSVLFIGATAYQAYRGFDKKGTKSVYGWIMGGMSVGFYFGNIYGSAKAARIFNTHQQSIYVDTVTDYYIDHF